LLFGVGQLVDRTQRDRHASSARPRSERWRMRMDQRRVSGADGGRRAALGPGRPCTGLGWGTGRREGLLFKCSAVPVAWPGVGMMCLHSGLDSLKG